ncbi:MAG: ACT domain-containing protein, partial [Candidatus Caldarchaeum sp.]|nr:ACT domain-containing protein [Candidatus Caldarchaeum sp.]MDW8434829.1 ACT domain-containing protein [Candidatus Caldarchaeum sp.]
GVTDDLLKSAQRINPDAPPDLLDELLAMGERTSARLFTLALKKKGVDAVLVDPDSEIWPVVTDGKHLDATPIIELCRPRVKSGVEKLLDDGIVPVVCGYVGVSVDGKITTMGRGGSDTTAVLLANCLEADEVVLVKDVAGIYSADPNKSSEAQILEILNADEVLKLSKGGAKIVHSKALLFLHPRGKIRIGSLDTIEQTGTVILGAEIPRLDVVVDDTNVTMVTVIGQSMGEPSKLSAAMKAVETSGGKLVAASAEEESLILYLRGDGEIVEKIHDYFVQNGLGKAVSHFPHLSVIRIYGAMLELVPGVVSKVVQPLAAKAVNLFGVLTISSSIRVFVSTREVEKAVKLIRENLAEYLSTQPRDQPIS